MTASKCGISRCGLCRFYHHEGRRGGSCSQLDAPVSAKWSACSLAVPAFDIALKHVDPAIQAKGIKQVVVKQPVTSISAVRLIPIGTQKSDSFGAKSAM